VEQSTVGLIAAQTFNYLPNHTYKYDYKTTASLDAANQAGTEKSQVFETTAILSFNCLSVTSEHFAFSMSASNVYISTQSDGQAKETGHDPALDAIFERPIYFKLTKAGQLIDIHADSEDEDDIVVAKVSMIESIRSATSKAGNSRVEIDTQGQHYVHYDVIPASNGFEVMSFYTSNDLIFMRDPNTDVRKLVMDSDGHQTVVQGIMKSNVQRITVSLAPSLDNDYPTSNTQLSTVGTATTTFISSSATPNPDSRRRRHVQLVPFMSDAFYSSRPIPTEELISSSSPNEDCPYGIELCLNPGFEWWCGDQRTGLQVKGSVVVGTNKGCSDPYRNIMVGAYFTLDIWVLSHQIKAIDAYVEYGYIAGAAQRNAIHVAIFNAQVYHKAFPELPCWDKTINLVNVTKDFSLPLSWQVYIITIQLSLGITLQAQVDLYWQICLTTWNAQIAIIPQGGVSAFADASASIQIAKGGLRLTATVHEKVDPNAYISLGLCRIGVKATSYMDPFHVQFIGYYQIRKWLIGAWGPRKEKVFWEWSWGGHVQLLFDKYIELWK